MTLESWWQKVNGWEVTIPKGTDIAKYHGETKVLEQDTKVLITVDAGEARALIRKALRNVSKRSRDGALTAKVQR